MGERHRFRSTDPENMTEEERLALLEQRNVRIAQLEAEKQSLEVEIGQKNIIIAQQNARIQSLEKEVSQSLIDPLTGVWSQKYFKEFIKPQIDEHIELCKSGEQHRSEAIFFGYADIDNFKVINDTQGYSAGDKALASAGRTLINSVRPVDTVYRDHGDEFGIILRVQTDVLEPIATKEIEEVFDQRCPGFTISFVKVDETFESVVDAKDKADELMRRKKKAKGVAR